MCSGSHHAPRPLGRAPPVGSPARPPLPHCFSLRRLPHSPEASCWTIACAAFFLPPPELQLGVGSFTQVAPPGLRSTPQALPDLGRSTQLTSSGPRGWTAPFPWFPAAVWALPTDLVSSSGRSSWTWPRVRDVDPDPDRHAPGPFTVSPISLWFGPSRHWVPHADGRIPALQTRPVRCSSSLIFIPLHVVLNLPNPGPGLPHAEGASFSLVKGTRSIYSCDKRCLWTRNVPGPVPASPRSPIGLLSRPGSKNV